MARLPRSIVLFAILATPACSLLYDPDGLEGDGPDAVSADAGVDTPPPPDAARDTPSPTDAGPEDAVDGGPDPDARLDAGRDVEPEFDAACTCPSSVRVADGAVFLEAHECDDTEARTVRGGVSGPLVRATPGVELQLSLPGSGEYAPEDDPFTVVVTGTCEGTLTGAGKGPSLRWTLSANEVHSADVSSSGRVVWASPSTMPDTVYYADASCLRECGRDQGCVEACATRLADGRNPHVSTNGRYVTYLQSDAAGERWVVHNVGSGETHEYAADAGMLDLDAFGVVSDINRVRVDGEAQFEFVYAADNNTLRISRWRSLSDPTPMEELVVGQRTCNPTVLAYKNVFITPDGLGIRESRCGGTGGLDLSIYNQVPTGAPSITELTVDCDGENVPQGAPIVGSNTTLLHSNCLLDGLAMEASTVYQTNTVDPGAYQRRVPGPVRYLYGSNSLVNGVESSTSFLYLTNDAAQELRVVRGAGVNADERVLTQRSARTARGTALSINGRYAVFAGLASMGHAITLVDLGALR